MQKYFSSKIHKQKYLQYTIESMFPPKKDKNMC